MRAKTLLFFLIVYTSTFSQTISEKFDEALNLYQNTLQNLNNFNEDDYLDFLESEDDLYEMEKNFIFVYNQMSEIYDSQNSTYRFGAAYYALLSNEKLARVYNHQSRFEDAYNTLKEITSHFDGTKPINIPITYPFNGKNYEVQATHVQNFKAEYYLNMSKTCYSLGKHSEAVNNMNNLIKLENASVEKKHIAYKHLIKIRNGNKYNFTNDEAITNLTSYIQNYYQLTPEHRQAVLTDTTEISHYKALDHILDETKNGILSKQSISNIANTLLMASTNNSHSETIFDLYLYTLNNYYSSNDYSGNQYAYNLKKTPYDFFTAVENAARYAVNFEFKNNDYLSTALNILSKKEKDKAKQAAQQALQRMADLAVLQNNCEQLAVAINGFENWEFAAELARYSKLIEPCKLAVKKEQERKLRAEKRANSKFNIYAGIYPFGLMTKRENMDFGGVLNFTSKKSAFEFSYLKIANKQENYFDIWAKEIDYEAEDLPKWDGYYTHFQYKAFSGYDPIYTGFLLGYATKNFGAMTTEIVNTQNNSLSTANFDPSTKQYIFMVNEGVLSLSKGFGYDAYFGIGVSYNVFDSGNSTLDRTVYQIKNTTLQNRENAYFSYMMRVGLTIGLNIGKGNRR